MKKVFFILYMGLLVNFAYALPINIKNVMSYFGEYNQNIILVADKENMQSSDSSWATQISNAMSDMAYIDNQLFYGLYQWEDSDEHPWASVGYRTYLSDDNGNPGTYLGYLSFTLQANPSDAIVTNVKFTNTTSPQYTFSPPLSINYINQANFEIYGNLTVYTMPIITNSNWISGMGNNYDSFTSRASFWTQDYGMDEPGRWTVSQTEQSIQQSTQPMSGNSGSRAYPLIQDAAGQYQPGVGNAFDGVWQVDIKIGSNGSGAFCETFYLAERKNLAPGPQNYMDGSGSASGGNGREIDIMETKWHPNGPQVNLPNGGGTSWNAGKYQSVQMASWSEIGGAPTSQYITFGAYIKNNVLWLYAYKPDGSLLYSTEAIPLTNKTYVQNAPFVPYIGTWGSGTGNFYTKYKNFIYVPSSQIPDDINPYTNPTEFYDAVHLM